MGKPLKKKETKRLRKATAEQAIVPEKKFLRSYISRKIINDMSEFDVFDLAREHKHNVLIEGPTGPGKTSAARAYAAREGMSFYAVPSNIGIEPTQLFGKYIPDGSGGFAWQDGPVTQIARHGGVLLINEVNFMPERVATVLFGLLDMRRQITLMDHKAEVIDASDKDILIMADMNPDYEGTRPLNKAFRNRFAIQLWWDYDPEVEAQLVDMPELLKMAGQIREDTAAGAYETPVSTNMLMEFQQIALTTSLDFALLNFQNHFAQEERAPIKVVCDTYRGNLLADIHELQRDDEDEEDEEPGLDSAYPEGHPIWEDRMNAEDGWVDPEWGVKGDTWVFSE